MKWPLFLAKVLIHTRVARWLPRLRRRLGRGSEFLHHYSDRLLSAPLEDLDPLAAALEPLAADVIDLTQGSPRFDLLPTTSAKLPADRRGWPPVRGLLELRIAIAEWLRVEGGLEANPENEVLISTGAVGAVHTALDAVVNRGDRVVLMDPSTPLYPMALRTRGARIRWLQTWVEDGRTRFHLAHLARALRGARLLVISSPANPTGGVLSADDLEQIAWWADRNDVLILSDEVFSRYRYEDEPLSIGAIPRARERTLTIGSVSKSHALTAARVGWLVAYRHLLTPCVATAALRTPFVSTLCQQIALAALQTRRDSFEAVRAGFESRRRYAYERLRAMELKPQWPRGAFFLWVPVWEKGWSGRQFSDALLRDKKVAVTPGDLFGPSGRGFVRLSYATDDGRLQEGLNRLGDFLEVMPTPEESRRRAA
jgi:aspartate/methionine/tyrosine aminotransferase